MFMWIKWMLCAVSLSLLTGCSGMMQYLEKLQQQPAENLALRSSRFQPRFQFDPPRRQALTPEEQQKVGPPPPKTGEVLLNGERYYSANGNICQYYYPKGQNATQISSACFVNGKWVGAVPLLNTAPLKR
ncbi:hypothetical protein [Thiolinea disciformis]|uniref:hypothetical protein n=1 Tax=Thiolinea disciformis TaxID=125614 RepID=UPI00035D9297|nr:hypothetical protein [Thiolinea disciformis]